MLPKEAKELVNKFTGENKKYKVSDLGKVYLFANVDDIPTGSFQLCVNKETKEVGFVSIYDLGDSYTKAKPVII